jgi:hypothetical protein
MAAARGDANNIGWASREIERLKRDAVGIRASVENRRFRHLSAANCAVRGKPGYSRFSEKRRPVVRDPPAPLADRA